LVGSLGFLPCDIQCGDLVRVTEFHQNRPHQLPHALLIEAFLRQRSG